MVLRAVIGTKDTLNISMRLGPSEPSREAYVIVPYDKKEEMK